MINKFTNVDDEKGRAPGKIIPGDNRVVIKDI
jgi:hypothetical protein